jgi:cellulose synthase/poly-beta-1,6-N-acetylglucosamine synthase-like glycosyltransferase
MGHPLVTLEGLEGYETLQALVRLHGTPMGIVVLPVVHGKCSAMLIGQTILDQLHQPILCHLVSDALANLPPSGGLDVADLVNVRHPTDTGLYPLVTVAICSRDRTDDLALCLEALSHLDYPNLDLLVVDNAPTTRDTERLVRGSYPNIRYICEPRPGLDWARNRAIAEARGQIIAFTDDDVMVDPGWVTALTNVFVEDPQVMAVTGLVLPYELETEAQVLFEWYGGFGRGFTRRWYQVDRPGGERAAKSYAWAGMFGTGANMAFRCSLFQQIGTFDPALDVGTAANGGGDLEMFFRLLKEGHTLVYEPSGLRITESVLAPTW